MDSIERLVEKIDNYNARRHLSSKKKKKRSKLLMASVEMFSGTLVGGIIGYFADKIFNTGPIILLICIIVGILSSFYNIYKLMLR